MLFVNATLKANEKLNFYLEGVLTTAQGYFDSFGDLSPAEGAIDEHSIMSPEHDGGTKGAYDFGVISDYSDLDYTTLEGTIGANYKLDQNASLYGSINLMDLQDDQAYVYGDLTGSIITYAGGMSVGF